jgi:hypothetical protein
MGKKKIPLKFILYFYYFFLTDTIWPLMSPVIPWLVALFFLDVPSDPVIFSEVLKDPVIFSEILKEPEIQLQPEPEVKSSDTCFIEKCIVVLIWTGMVLVWVGLSSSS